MRVELVKEFTFEAVDRLPHFPAGHQCPPLQSHSFRVAVTVESKVDCRAQTGHLIDYDDIQKAVEPFLDQHLDHHDLSAIEGLGSPTLEHLSQWIWERIKDRLPGLKRVSVEETSV